MKAMIVVTHLLGTGHLSRALTLARAFLAAGDEVTVVSGGLPVPHFKNVGIGFEQLEPVRSNGVDFSTLLTADGAEATPDMLLRREDQMLSILRRIQPDILMTELFPFGRRILRQEFQALLQAAKSMTPAPVVLSSIRDILAPPSKPKKVVFAEELVSRFYDGVLVHSDPDVVTLEHSWPVTAALQTKLCYTGYVAPPPPRLGGQLDQTVLVSAGGGSVGDALFAAAIQAASEMPQMQWRLFVGGAEARRGALQAEAADNVTIEAPHPEFRQFLASAAASVSMAGYNTALDVMQTGVPAVLVPFDDGGEVEQGLRADALGQMPGIAVLRQEALDAATLARAVNDVITTGRRAPRTQTMDGARETVQIAHQLRKAAL
ncbi:glycosyltransferase family protein [Tateyamaria sp.]|uniref:glycosyltransferase family protein n=1 Tax=Tateyamaria sp. TaxID=1929288 RepID=UPI003B20D46D